MRIGILSMQTVNNYGSVLQAYSLKEMVNETVDAKVEFISPKYDDAFAVKMPVQDSGDYKGTPYLPFGKLTFFARKAVNKLKVKKFEKKMEEFRADFLNGSGDGGEGKFDIVIEGSDEVFKATKLFSFYMYGEIPNTKKLITYAAASGSTAYEGLPSEKIEDIKKSMKNFAAMSVRDTYTQEYIEKLYSGKIERHLDPVLVGNLSQLEHKRREKKPYMIVYAYRDRIRSEREIKAIKRFASERGLKLLAVGAPQYWCDSFLPLSPFELLDYFYFAEYVVTDTFHGAVFSIINHSNFAVMIRESNRNKMLGLLEGLRLKDRIADSPEKIESILNCPPDYEKTDEIISEEKLKTREFLNRNLKMPV